MTFAVSDMVEDLIRGLDRDDGTYDATVTTDSGTYSVPVEVENGEVTQVHWPVENSG